MDKSKALPANPDKCTYGTNSSVTNDVKNRDWSRPGATLDARIPRWTSDGDPIE